MGPTDEDLVHRYRHGDDSAFEALLERHGSGALRFARHLVGEIHSAEEVVQDCFVKLITVARRGGFDPARGRFAPFFFRMIRNQALDRLRARGPRGTIHPDLPNPDGTEASHDAIRNERRAEVRALVGRLPENERSAIVLREFEGMSYREIAETMDANLETVKTWIFRARRRIQEAWMAAHAEEGDPRAL